LIFESENSARETGMLRSPFDTSTRVARLRSRSSTAILTGAQPPVSLPTVFLMTKRLAIRPSGRIFSIDNARDFLGDRHVRIRS